MGKNGTYVPNTVTLSNAAMMDNLHFNVATFIDGIIGSNGTGFGVFASMVGFSCTASSFEMASGMA